MIKEFRMDCKILHKNIIEYLDNESSAQIRQDIKKHLQTCAECQKLVFEIENTYTIPLSDKITEPDTYFYTHMEARLESRLSPKTSFLSQLVPAMRTIAACLAILFSLASGAVIGFGFPSETDSSIDNQNISYVDQYTQDYHLFEMDDEILENVLLTE